MKGVFVVLCVFSYIQGPLGFRTFTSDFSNELESIDRFSHAP